jgi:hypothetical protein
MRKSAIRWSASIRHRCRDGAFSHRAGQFQKALKFDDAWWTAHSDELQKALRGMARATLARSGQATDRRKPPEPVQPPPALPEHH